MAEEHNTQVRDSLQDVTLGHSMDESHQTSLDAALQEYRDTVRQHNFEMLRILVEGMAKQTAHDIRPEDIEQFRLRPFSVQYFNWSDLPESVKVVHDLLSDEVWTQLVAEHSLDGVSHSAVDLVSRDNWFREVQAQVAPKLPTDTSFPPPELRYLCSLVSGITGAGLPYFRNTEQIEFISEIPEPISEVVYTHKQLNAIEPLWKQWQIAVACKLGEGLRTHSGSVAVFCRSRSGELGWQWRYGMFDEGWCSKLYDTLEEFLAWYAHHAEQTAESVKDEAQDLYP